ncbi:MAG: alpha/beta fold hydrolase [Reyranellaceae bacterium]
MRCVAKWLALAAAALLALSIVAILAVGLRFDIPVEALKPRYAGGASRFVEVDGLNVHYRDQGPRGAPALLLLHGSSASLHTWEGWERLLRAEFRVVSVDLPGHGLTGPWPKDGDYSLDGYARFVDRFTRRIGVERFSLVGNSMGGAVAWTYAARYPQRAEKLILIDAVGWPRPPAQRFFGFVTAPLTDFALRWITPRFVVARTLRALYGDPAKVEPALVDRYRDLVLRAGNRAAISKRFRAFDPDPALLGTLRLPVLVLWGGKDWLLLPAEAFRFQNAIADARLRIYSQAGHMPMEEMPEITAQDARAFLRER